MRTTTTKVLREPIDATNENALSNRKGGFSFSRWEKLTTAVCLFDIMKSALRGGGIGFHHPTQNVSLLMCAHLTAESERGEERRASEREIVVCFSLAFEWGSGREANRKSD